VKKLLFILLVFVGEFVNAQNFDNETQQQVDSFSLITGKSNISDTIIVRAYFELANLYYLSNPPLQLVFVEKQNR
jgi:hypothetical protein